MRTFFRYWTCCAWRWGWTKDSYRIAPGCWQCGRCHSFYDK